MTYVPPEKRDTAYYIFNEKYLCRVPYLATRSEDHLRKYGMPITGLPEYDKGLANELQDRYLSIAQMVEFYKKGVVVRVVKYGDTKRIYERITDHLVAWQEALKWRLNIGNAPLEDLVIMDQFANAVYEHAKYQFEQTVVESLLLRSMTEAVPITAESLMKAFQQGDRKKLPIEQQVEAEQNELPKRTPMEDFFSSFQRPGTMKKERWS